MVNLPSVPTIICQVVLVKYRSYQGREREEERRLTGHTGVDLFPARSWEETAGTHHVGVLLRQNRLVEDAGKEVSPWRELRLRVEDDGSQSPPFAQRQLTT
jgi:hypothetical protein